MKDNIVMRHTFNLRLSAIGIFFLASCAVGPNYQPPELHVPNEYLPPEGLQCDLSGAEVKWWGVFGDPLLVNLVERALGSNLSIMQAGTRIEEARALRRAASLDFFPSVRSSNYYSHSKQSDELFPEGFNFGNSGELYHVGFDATWELDLFGRVRRNYEANDAVVAQTEAEQEAAKIAIAAEVARTYIELRGFESQLRTATKNAESQRDTWELTKALREGGRGTELDTLSAETQLAQTRASIPPLKSALVEARLRLATLLGELPGALDSEFTSEAAIPSSNAVVKIGDPKVLLRRRPDIIAAERALAALTAKVGVATADLFPRVTFQGAIGLEAPVFSALSNSGADAWSFGPRLSWGAFDIGRELSALAAANARVSGALYRYKDTVLRALLEVEANLEQVQRERDALAELQHASNVARQAVGLARERYQAGVDSFLNVLEAERRAFGSDLAAVAAQSRTSVALVALYKSLGGGDWENK